MTISKGMVQEIIVHVYYEIFNYLKRISYNYANQFKDISTKKNE